MTTLNFFKVCVLFLVTATLPNISFGQAKLTDPEIANVAVVANQIDIDYAKLAMQKSKNAEILAFAKTMANDHKAVIDQAVALVKKLGVTPKDNSFGRQLQAGAKKTTTRLKVAKGKAFEKAYIDNEVAYHKAVISAVEGRLIPESQNAELRNLLQQVLPTLKAHLQHAEMVQKNHK